MNDCVARDEQSLAPSRSRCLQRGYFVELLSNAAIPLMIGVVSLSIAIHQQKVAQSNRDNDASQGAELRKQDRQQGVLQRTEDKTISRLQRTEDKETARLQRQLDLQMANDKRLQDNELAERQRNLSEHQRSQESQLARKMHFYNLLLEDERQKESVLFEYQNDLATLLLDHESKSNRTRSTWWFVLQMKTGTALRQLDPTRRTILVQTLLEAGLLDVKLDNRDALLYSANLSGVQFSQAVFHPNFNKYEGVNKPLVMPRADLRHASFRNALLSKTLSLAYSNLDYTDWSFAQITNVFFRDDMSMNGATFYASLIYGTHFDGYRSTEINFHRQIKMNGVSFEYNVLCSHCFFQRVSLLGIRLNHSTFYEGKFTSLSMADANLSNGSFASSTFQAATLDRVDLSGADLRLCKFIFVSMIDCLMYGTKFQQTSFSNTNLTGCQGLDVANTQIKFYQTTLPNGTYIKGPRN